jgi:hypothetical protein
MPFTSRNIQETTDFTGAVDTALANMVSHAKQTVIVSRNIEVRDFFSSNQSAPVTSGGETSYTWVS